jgi:SAM-dependent methyltransferase
VTAQRDTARGGARARPKRYDRAYFDKWYRSERHAVRSPEELARKVALAVAVAEYVLDRPIRSVLDVGAGEGAWLAPLRRLRPRVRYLGVDQSEYAVARFGRRRNLVRGSVETLPAHAGEGPFDLVVCADVLNYLPTPALAAGLAHVRRLLGGVAYLEIFAAGESMEGDLRGWHRRPAAFYRHLFDRVGLTTVGPHCYAPPAGAAALAAHQRRRATSGDTP